ncbi:MAG: cyclohexanecarboxylate-CoA ligase [Alphaproteobacteria bacterium]|nr:cyclohexanecarboxylate-CoA ligase [Alphaproteobacteria bacterium]
MRIATREETYRRKWRALGLHAGRTIAEEIALASARNPGLALHFSSGGRETPVTFAEIAAESLTHAAGLAALGLRQGDRMMVQAPHSRDNMILFAAAMALGLVVVPVVGIYGSAELSYIAGRTGARAIAVPGQWRDVDHAGRIRAIEPDSSLETVITLGEPGSREYGLPSVPFGSLEGVAFDPPAISPNDPAVIIFTSGSTGQAKGVVHTHETAMAELRAASPFIDQLATRTLLSPLPTGHIAGIMALLRPFIHAMPTVYLDHWSVPEAVRLINEHGVGWTYGTPFHISGLIDASADTPMPTFKACQCGGAGVPGSLIERAGRARIAACRSYGSTEQPTITANLPNSPLQKRINSDGPAMPGVEIRLVTEDGRTAAPGEPGEIVCTGAEQFVGYLDESENQGAFDEEGWFRTGDIGVADEEGYIRIVDRKKDIIIRGGENIASREVEDEVMRHPRVLEAAAVGVPDEIYGERVAAVVILREGTLDLAELKDQFAKAGLAIQKVPERLFIISDLPRTPLGKIAKQQLREMIARSEF